MTDKSEAQIVAQIIANLQSCVDDLEKALEAAKAEPTAYIYAWTSSHLGVKLSGSDPIVVGAAHATVFDRTSRLSFVNGAGFPAELVNRREALEVALASARQTLAEVPAKFTVGAR